MKVAIVEDNTETRESLAQMITQQCKELNIPSSIKKFNDGIAIVDQYQGDFDVIYFDVEMPIMDGMTAAKKIRKTDPNVRIVFITNHVQWAIEGYSVDALDFLLKPVNTFNFQEHFKKIIKEITYSSKESYVLKTSGGIRKIYLEDLIFVESEGHYLYFHTTSDTYTVLSSMKKVEADLKDTHFFRCNNSYLVNLEYVHSIEGNIVHVGEYDLTVSRPRKKSFLTALTDYLGEGGTS